MSNLLRHIEDTNKAFINEIINAIKDDNDWLINLGISESELNKNILIPDFISKYLSNPENLKTIDLLLKYVITDFLDDDDHIPLIKHVVSANSYGRKSALFVFKCYDLYFCYFTGEKMETLITENPEAFCWVAAKSIIDFHEIEKESLEDDWFSDSDAYTELTLNFDFDKS
jgi:hypothetical protein